MIPQKQSVTSTVRKLCEEIETEINIHLKRIILQTSGTSQRNNDGTRGSMPGMGGLERTLEELKSAVVQVVTSRLPALITMEEGLSDRIMDLVEQRDEWCQKYKSLFRQYQQGQLQNDRLKIEVVALSDSYQQLSIAFETLKYQHNELKQQRQQNFTKNFQSEHNPSSTHQRLAELVLLSRDSASSSDLQNVQTPTPILANDPNNAQSMRLSTQAMLYQKQLFLQQIRTSQKELFSFKTHLAQVQSQCHRLKEENQELQRLLVGQKGRSDRCDREVMQVLNRNQEIKLELLEEKEGKAKIEEQLKRLRGDMEQQRNEYALLLNQKSALGQSLLQQKQVIAQLKLENSQLREVTISLEQRQRDFRGKVTEMKEQNQQLRGQLEKIISQLNQKTAILQKTKKQSFLLHQRQLQEHRLRVTQLEHSSKTNLQDKMKQISKMHKEITQKLQQKIHLLSKSNVEKKQKCSKLKYEIERLYESLRIQVEKEFALKEKIKELEKGIENGQKNWGIAEERTKIAEQGKRLLEDTVKSLKMDLNTASTRLKRYTDLCKNLSLSVLPRLKQQLCSTRQLCHHFCSMVQLQKQQTSLLLSRQQQHFSQLITQSSLQNSIARDQMTAQYQQQLSKWKQNCRLYQQRYDRLRGENEASEQQYAKLRMEYEESVKTCGGLVEENQKRKMEQVATGKTIEKLREKCRQVEQYYKLIEDLSRENLVLRTKLQTSHSHSPSYSPSYYSFKSPQRPELDSTSKRQRTTPDDPLQQYNKTTNISRPGRSQEVNMHDLTAKAEFQKLRLEAARKEYQMVNRNEG